MGNGDEMTVPSRRRFGKALDTMKSEHVAALITAAAPFARVANVLDALGTISPTADCPLRDVMPAAWPTVGDARKLRDELVRLGWKS